MSSAHRFVALLAAVLLSGCSSFEQRVVAVENRQSAIENQIADLQRQQNDISTRLQRIQQDLDGALDPLRAQNADRGESLRATQREVTALEAQIAEIDARIARLTEDVSAGAGGPASAAVGPAMPPARGQRSVDSGSETPSQISEAQELYNSAFNDSVRDNFELCVQGFEEYIRRYPNSARAANARYWIGVCYRGQGRTEDARLAFRQVVEQYPSSEVVDDAMFNDALLLVSLGRQQDAIDSFARLIQAYPNGDIALLACAQLGELGAEQPAICQR